MKTIKTAVVFTIFGIIGSINGQESRVKTETRLSSNQDRMAYYEQRGAEDARFELEFKAKSKADEKAFWKEQQAYEKNLKKQNRTAYRAYMAGKQDAYAEHYHYCDAHCYHGDGFYQHAGFYYYGYYERDYRTSPRSSSVNTQIRVTTPTVRLGVF